MNRVVPFFVCFLLLAGCAAPTIPTPMPTAPAATATRTPSQTTTLTFTPAPSFTPTFTLTPMATVTNTPQPFANAIPIIEYHDPEFKMNAYIQMTGEWFLAQLDWLAQEGFHTLTAEELAAYLDGAADFPLRSIVLTFDVGSPQRKIYREVVIPALRERGFHALFFLQVNTQFIGEECNQEQVFCWDDFRGWLAEGVISVGSHSISHADFATLTTSEMRFEAQRSREILESQLGVPVIAFAYPYESAPDNSLAVVKAAGYQYAMVGQIRPNLGAQPNDPGRYRLPRIHPYSNPNEYPNLTGMGRTFEQLISQTIGAGATSAIATPAITGTPMASVESAEYVKQVCAAAPVDDLSRQLYLKEKTFATDLSPAAVAQLPGVFTSPSCNFFHGNRPEAIVLHYTAGPLSGAINNFYKDKSSAAHYIIDVDGTVYQMVPETLGALHANCNGVRSQCVASCPICEDGEGHLTEPYNRSIGIEIVNYGRVIDPTQYSGALYEDYLHAYGYTYWADYTEAQLASLKILVYDIANRWGIPVDSDHVIGHYRINSRPDPGPALNLFWPRVGYPPRAPIFP